MSCFLISQISSNANSEKQGPVFQTTFSASFNTTYSSSLLGLASSSFVANYHQNYGPDISRLSKIGNLYGSVNDVYFQVCGLGIISANPIILTVDRTYTTMDITTITIDRE